MSDGEHAIRNVERAADHTQIERRKLDLAMREAHAAGASLRAIAKAAGVSHEQVRRTISKEDK